jgi:lysophospholipase L1-like esterase
MRSRALEILKLFAINGLVLFVLLNLIYWSLPVLQVMMGRSGPSAAIPDPNSHLPNYANIGWAEQHFRELGQAQLNRDTTDFKSFIGWRRKPFKGETINVDGPYAQRRTVNHGTDGAKRAFFFGGSTMWGTGANDEGTIPSQFAALTGMNSDNFGEAGYTAHQSLMLLIQLLQEGHRPDLVVFYDGVNEVAIKCVTELTPDSHMLESRIDILLKEQASSPASFSHYLAPIWRVAGRVKSILVGTTGTAREGYNCHSNSHKGARIADNVVRDWQMAKRIVESYGAKFIGILQPVLYVSRTRHDHLDDGPPLMRAQFQTAYPLIKQRMADAGVFYDLTSALDIDEYIYVDFAHVSPNGNRLVAARIAEIAGSLGFAP